MKALDTVITPIHKEGQFFVALFFAISLILFFLVEPLGWVGFLLTAWCYYFFRDPDRVISLEEGVVVSPGDGTVSAISIVPPPPELEMGEAELVRVSVFLNVFNVHVNRIPVAGTVSKLVHVSGEFLNAADSEAGEKNERQLAKIETEDGQVMAIAQVAGLVARRIICDLKEGQDVKRGDRYGLIRFGSRMDIYLPQKMQATVRPGQTMIGGETIIARNKND